MKTLILFSTRDGQTREIAAFLASELKEQGIYSDVINLNRTDEIAWQEYDRVVIGASIRYGHFHPAVDRFVKKHVATLNSLPGAFYSVNLVARKAEKRTPQTNSYTRKFLLNSPWKPAACAVFAGALRYPTLSLVRPLYDPSYYEDDRRRNRYAQRSGLYRLVTGRQFRPGNCAINPQFAALINVKREK
ncbi:Protoporphyrinogen IX dehydrogenase [menaquinone] [Leclercia adecarboxylata]|uniref:Protoporphyrinogen IX dehydrogenase [menaquinone] n=1 Tax=Leclercia adecarboxylata TaxID=83655 RepID=A0A4U9IVI0_9ENTR|nr:Protoporphyrinogen IX dehydrogenase [menaquinone] [Leclercia adecarboxylata]